MNCSKNERHSCSFCGQTFIPRKKYQTISHGEVGIEGEVFYYFCSKKCRDEWEIEDFIDQSEDYDEGIDELLEPDDE